jgi:pimeloyl-ACP methyl ester carboxylesterase
LGAAGKSRQQVLSFALRHSKSFYYEDNRTPLHFQKGDYVTAPCGIALFPKREGPLPSRRWAEPGFNIQHWTEMPRGGHFPALEEPELLVEDIRLFFGALRS